MKRASNARAGMTLIEVLIAITLLSLLMTGMLWAIRIGVNTLGKANERLIANRRVTGAQRILEQEIAGLIPVAGILPGGGGANQAGNQKFLFFQGEAQSMRFVSSYSLQEASRGGPRILEFTVIPGADGNGARLIVNEAPYTGPRSAGALAIGRGPAPEAGGVMTRYAPIGTGPQSFVLADKLSGCRFLYQELRPRPEYERWTDLWTKDRWPDAIRVEMNPLEDLPGRLKLVSMTVPVRVQKLITETYADQ